MLSTTKRPPVGPYLLFVSGLIAFDQGTKFLVRQEMELGQSIPILENVFHLTYIENKGAAFGAFAGATPLLSLASVIIIGFMWVYILRLSQAPKEIYTALSLITAGGIGNLIDRLIRGSVTDMFDFRIWPIFNVADIAVTFGVVLLMVLVLRHDEDADA